MRNIEDLNLYTCIDKTNGQNYMATESTEIDGVYIVKKMICTKCGSAIATEHYSNFEKIAPECNT